MGVADNKSYKDMYHFKDSPYGVDRSDLPSINIDPEINTSIKENPYRSNVEIEKDEIILQPDLSALFKARGKKHSGGGIDVNLKPESFIFSDDRRLSFDEKDHKLFELKEGGNFNKTTNTPADVLKRNINLEHYNRMVSNLQDIKKDDFAKRSSAMMLEKYIQTLGNIAFVQEGKKDFPDGVPAFAEGTAPIYDTELKNEVESQKQYAKYGGEVMFHGGFTDDPCPCGKNADGTCIEPCPEEIYQKILKERARKVQTPAPDYRHLYDTPTQSLYGKYGKEGQRQTAGPKMSNDAWRRFLANETPAHKAKRLSRYETPDDYVFTPKLGAVNSEIPAHETAAPVVPAGTISNPFKTPAPFPVPNEVTGSTQMGKEIDWQFSPWQKFSQGYNALKYASAKRYMPYRSRFNASYVDPALVNPEQTIGDIQGQANTQLGALGTLNPILRNAQASQVYGQFLDKVPGVRAQYDNQNVGIKNQFRGMNNQIRNQESMTNMQNDARYYQESIVGQQNFDNMKGFLGDQYMNNLLRDVETNQSLAYNLTTLGPNPAYGYNFKTGNFYRNEKNILDSPGNPVDSEYNLLLEDIKSISDPNERLKRRLELEKIKKFNSAMSRNGMGKKGGTFNPYK